MMNPFDYAIIRAYVTLANRWPAFDGFVNFLSSSNLAKGALALSLFWYAWFSLDERPPYRRQILVSSLFGSACALAIAMVLALALPFRLRPVLQYPVPGGVQAPTWDQWSAFPSDHATLFFALAMGLYRVSPRLGLLGFTHALILVASPRIYLGLHYPTDILAGAAIGIVAVLVCTSERFREPLARYPLKWEKQSPALFYACLFLVSYLVATLFTDLRVGAERLFHGLNPH